MNWTLAEKKPEAYKHIVMFNMYRTTIIYYTGYYDRFTEKYYADAEDRSIDIVAWAYLDVSYFIKENIYNELISKLVKG